MFRTCYDTVRTQKIEKKLPELFFDAYSCDMCDKGGWLTPNDVEIHKKKSHFQLIVKYKSLYKNRFCTVCMKLLSTHSELLKHIKTQHLLSSPNAQRIERKIYICDKCSKIFFNKDVLSIHMMSAHLIKKGSRGNKLFTCPKCLKSFQFKTLWFHLLRHEIPSIYLCDICLTNFPSQEKLQDHLKTHKQHLKCDPCGYLTNHMDQYEKHMEKHNMRVISQRELPETLLSSIFKKKNKTTVFRYNVHNPVKGLCLPGFIKICTLCRAICISPGERSRHVLRDHFVEEVQERKRHLCACGEEFEYKVVLKQHLLKMKGSHRAVDGPEFIEENINHEIKIENDHRIEIEILEDISGQNEEDDDAEKCDSLIEINTVNIIMEQ